MMWVSVAVSLRVGPWIWMECCLAVRRWLVGQVLLSRLLAFPLAPLSPRQVIAFPIPIGGAGAGGWRRRMSELTSAAAAPWSWSWSWSWSLSAVLSWLGLIVRTVLQALGGTPSSLLCNFNFNSSFKPLPSDPEVAISLAEAPHALPRLTVSPLPLFLARSLSFALLPINSLSVHRLDSFHFPSC